MLIATFQALHLLCAAFWLGSLLYTEMVLWPRLRPAGMLEPVQAQLRNVTARKILAIFVVGTIVSGFVLGILRGAVDRLQTQYGVLFVLAAFIGVSMLTWWANFPTRDRKNGWRLFYSGFCVIFVLMIALRMLAAR
jgi:putative copper export protein